MYLQLTLNVGLSLFQVHLSKDAAGESPSPLGHSLSPG